MIGNIGVAELNFIKQLRPAFGVKWRQTHNHLIDQRTQTPPINRFSMPLFIQNLGSQILRSTTYRESIALGDVHFRKAKISEPEISNLVNQDIFGFETK